MYRSKWIAKVKDCLKLNILDTKGCLQLKTTYFKKDLSYQFQIASKKSNLYYFEVEKNESSKVF